MTKIKSVVLNKIETKNGYIVEFYNPVWGRFSIDCQYDKDMPAMNNTIKLIRVGDYFLVKGKSLEPNTEIKDYEIIKYMSQETEEARKSHRTLAIPNMNVQEMDALADKILQEIKSLSK